ncbi:hypothetical protein CQW23_06504 [Capsicum baccatum]|uniref:Uncharacterized protein n=1 Tax=Capsicum baccatum TaxID=33114 RepID=A0A2G2X3H5_CAPBA|nr:hypothetical protein CQW23_06504 [Capsicum baccatum]
MGKDKSCTLAPIEGLLINLLPTPPSMLADVAIITIQCALGVKSCKSQKAKGHFCEVSDDNGKVDRNVGFKKRSINKLSKNQDLLGEATGRTKGLQKQIHEGLVQSGQYLPSAELHAIPISGIGDQVRVCWSGELWLVRSSRCNDKTRDLQVVTCVESLPGVVARRRVPLGDNDDTRCLADHVK